MFLKEQYLYRIEYFLLHFKGEKTTIISSRENRLVKEYVGLRENKTKRRESGRFVIEGSRLAMDALLSGSKICTAFVTENARERYKDVCSALENARVGVYDVTDTVAHALADTQNTQGIFCTVEKRASAIELEKLDNGGAYLALENIQDPGNLGTIMRTAEAMGMDAIILSDGCTDVFSPKAVRASMGAIFRLPVISGVKMTDAINILRQKGIKTYAAVAGGDAQDILKSDLSGGIAAVIGNEGNGLTKECVSACDASITVHMRGRAESLNAAAAATVIIWEISKHRS